MLEAIAIIMLTVGGESELAKARVTEGLRVLDQCSLITQGDKVILSARGYIKVSVDKIVRLDDGRRARAAARLFGDRIWFTPEALDDIDSAVHELMHLAGYSHADILASERFEWVLRVCLDEYHK